MLNFALIFLCLMIGMGLRRLGKFPANAAQTLNTFVIHISLPAVVLTQLPPLLLQPIGWNMLFPIVMPWLLFGLSLVFFLILGQRCNWTKSTIGALVLTAGLGNTSFVGLPLLEALVGRHSTGIGILLDQLGTFLVLSTLGLVCAVRLSQRDTTPPTLTATLKRIFQFPPFLALLASLIWVIVGYSIDHPLNRVLERLASTLVPVALVAVGYQLHLSRRVLSMRWKPLVLGLGFKLFLAPLFFWIVFKLILQQQGEIIHITLLEAAMAPMITAAVVANDFDLDGEMANLMVGIGIPLSLLTVTAWHYCLAGADTMVR